MDDAPYTALQAACLALHEVYESLLLAGFTEHQALRILALMLAEINNDLT